MEKLNNIYLIKDYSNSYLIELKNEVILIDVGFDEKAEKILKKFLKLIIDRSPKSCSSYFY